MSTPTNPHQALSSDNEVLPASSNGEQLGNHATVFCYLKAGEAAQKLYVPIQGIFFSFIEDDNFSHKTAFLEVPFEIYDVLAGKFTPLPRSAYWRRPSPSNPFFITKNGTIENEDCPGLQKLTDLLDANQERYETGPQMRSSSLLPLSPPPPAQPLRLRESPGPSEKDGVQTVEELHPRKRKRSHSQFETEAPKTGTREADVKLTIHICSHGRSPGKKPRRGTGDGVSDPIII